MRIDSHLSRLSVLLSAGIFLAACPAVAGAQQAGEGASPATPNASSANASSGPATQQTSSQQQTPSQSANSKSAPLPSAPVSAAPVSVAQMGSIGGTVTDAQDDVVPDAEVTLEAPDPDDSRTAVANDMGAFQFDGLRPKVAYRITIRAKGFVDWKSDSIVLSADEYQYVPGIRLELSGEAASVTVHSSSTELAMEQVRIAEQQRVLGIVPNFYVAYDKNAPPLDAKAKFQLALKVSDRKS